MEAAHWTLIGVVVGGVITGFFGLFTQLLRFKHEKEMYLLKNRSTEVVKEILTEMLNHRSYIERSFVALKRKVGGYSDDEIRRLLHEVGAKRFTRDNGAEEWWYLASRQDELIEKRKGSS